MSESSCDFTTPLPEEEKLSMDEWLRRWKERHHAVARYQVIESRTDNPRNWREGVPIAFGLTWDEATKMVKEKTEAQPASERCRFTRTLWYPQLENREEVARVLGIPNRKAQLR